MDRSLARARYAQQKANAAKRGIEWEFTFEEWCEIWEPHWADRGSHKGGKVMCRTHDKGPYRPDNVRIDTVKGNAAEAVLMKKCSESRWNREKAKPGSPGGAISNAFFRSQGNVFLRPDKAMELQQKEYEWIPGE